MQNVGKGAYLNYGGVHRSQTSILRRFPSTSLLASSISKDLYHFANMHSSAMLKLALLLFGVVNAAPHGRK